MTQPSGDLRRNRGPKDHGQLGTEAALQSAMLPPNSPRTSPILSRSTKTETSPEKRKAKKQPAVEKKLKISPPEHLAPSKPSEGTAQYGADFKPGSIPEDTGSPTRRRKIFSPLKAQMSELGASSTTAPISSSTIEIPDFGALLSKKTSAKLDFGAPKEIPKGFESLFEKKAAPKVPMSELLGSKLEDQLAVWAGVLEHKPSSVERGRFGKPVSSGKSNLQCTLAAAATACGLEGWGALKGTHRFDVREHSDQDIGDLLAVNGFVKTNASALERHLDNGDPLWIRTSSQDLGGWHAYCAIGKTEDGKILAWDPDAKEGGFKKLDPRIVDADMLFVRR